MSMTLHSQTINVNRKNLILVLHENRKKHVAMFNEAVEGFQQAMVDKLKEVLAQAIAGKLKKLQLHLPEPISHEKEYTEAIEMLEFSVDDTIELDKNMFRAYVKDEWDWKHTFESVSNSYISSKKFE